MAITLRSVKGSELTSAEIDANFTGLNVDKAPLLNPSFVGTISLTTAGQAAVEIGRVDGVASKPVIDFHSGATSVDYDARIIASGGTGVAGGGTLTFTAASVTTSGSLGIGGVPVAGQSLNVLKNISGGVVAMGVRSTGVVQSDVTTLARGFDSTFTTAAASFTLNSFTHHYSGQSPLGAGSTVTTQYGYFVESNLIGATNNHGFFGNIPAGTGRYNLYMNGTAANYLAGDLQLGKTVTATGTTGAQTINKTTGTVNFAAAATSLVVTNSLVTANSIIIATVGTNDTTMKSVQIVASAGSFTVYANAAATAETRVNFLITN